MSMRIPRALTIAGSDSSGGAGIQADLKTFAALGVYGLSAVTAVTAQNSLGVQSAVELDPDIISRQIHAVVSDIGVDAAKTGMLANAAIVSRVARELARLDLKKLVVDPVMVAKGGHRLLRADAVAAVMHELFPLAMLVTPNLEEAEVLINRQISDLEGMREAAVRIKELGARQVLITGGHLPGHPVDLYYDGRDFREYGSERIDTPHTHGSGCTLASAVTAGLAKGLTLEDAIRQARAYVNGAIRYGLPLGKGHGPLHHFHELYRLAGWDWSDTL
jgi:hydroxymethylpyrimidine/phosphomethylpyrimidine kinase